MIAEIYHYYLHGPDGRASDSESHTVKATPKGRRGRGRAIPLSTPRNRPISHQNSCPGGDLKMLFRLYVDEQMKQEFNLSDIESDFQSRCQLKEADRFDFVIEIPEMPEKNGVSSGFTGEKTTVEGFIRYHPFHLTGETLPFRDEHTSDTEEDEESNLNVSRNSDEVGPENMELEDLSHPISNGNMEPPLCTPKRTPNKVSFITFFFKSYLTYYSLLG